MRATEFKDLKVGDRFKFDPQESHIYVKIDDKHIDYQENCKFVFSKDDLGFATVKIESVRPFRAWPDEDVLLVKG